MRLSKKQITCLAVSISVSLLVYACDTFLNINDHLQDGLVDYNFYLSDPGIRELEVADDTTTRETNRRASKSILILGIDNPTLTYLNDNGTRWPFPAGVYSRFIECLSAMKAGTVYLDIPLDEMNNISELSQSMKKAGNVAIKYTFNEKSGFSAAPDGSNSAMENLKNTRWSSGTETGKDDFDISNILEPAFPHESIIKAAAIMGHELLTPDSGGTLKKIPLVMKRGAYYYPSLALAVCMRFFRITMKDVEIHPGKFIILKNIPASKLQKREEGDRIEIPIDKNGFYRINYIGGAGTFESYSFSFFHRETCNENNDNNSLEGKIVLSGVYRTKKITGDIGATPLGSMNHVEIEAQVINNIIMRDFISEVGPAARSIVFFIFAIILGLAIPRMHWLLSTLISLVVMEAGLMIISYAAFALFHLIVPAIMFGQLITLNLIFTLPVMLLVKD